MEYLYAPWRSSYIEQVHGKEENITKNECVFCTCVHKDDASCYVLYRAKFWFIMLNRFPYNAGHILIVSYEHISTLVGMHEEARYELSDLTQISVEVLQKTIEPQGFNIGLNIGKVAGAGIPSHIHEHILPRWSGDTNFLPLLAQTKHISVNLDEMYQKLRKGFESYLKI